MPRIGRILLCCATLLLFAATGLGAYASHGMQAFDERAIAAVQTAVDFQFFHGLGLLALALLIDRYPQTRALWVAGALLVVGVILFSGAIYASRLGGMAELGRLAPAGGVCLMAGWLVFAWGGLRLAERA